MSTVDWPQKPEPWCWVGPQFMRECQRIAVGEMPAPTAGSQIRGAGGVMTDPDIITAVSEILVGELVGVTEAMLDAGSRAETALLVDAAPDGRRRLRPVREDQRLAAIWRAMLAVKLGTPLLRLATRDFPVPEHLKG